MLRRAYAQKPYEFALTILTVFAAAMAAVTGYSSGIAGEEEADLRGEGLSALAKANTNALQANQIILRDERILLQADFADVIGESEFAQELRGRTIIVRQGFFDLNGNPTPEYGGDRDTAVNAFIEDMYAPQRANQTISDEAFAKADIASQDEVRYLLATILFALGAVLASQGLSADSQRIRRLFTVIVSGYLVLPIVLTILALLG